jgi:dCTP diphosphatase
MKTGEEKTANSHATLIATLRAFVAERDWDQFHTPENLAKSISIEAGELLERFQWGGTFEAARVQEELADVLTYCHLLADKLGLDADEIVLEKLATTRHKYPVEKAKGRSTKYDQLED